MQLVQAASWVSAMFDRRILTVDATPLALEDHLAPIQSMLAMLGEFAVANAPHGDAQAPVGGGSLAARYAAASPIVRRRFDAILREAETIGAVGLKLVAARAGGADPATIAAARFLGRSIENALRRLEKLVPAHSC